MICFFPTPPHYEIITLPLCQLNISDDTSKSIIDKSIPHESSHAQVVFMRTKDMTIDNSSCGKLELEPT